MDGWMYSSRTRTADVCLTTPSIDYVANRLTLFAVIIVQKKKHETDSNTGSILNTGTTVQKVRSKATRAYIYTSSIFYAAVPE